MEKKRYYNDNVGANKENEILALKKALELCNEIGDITQIVFLIHTKGNTGYLERIFNTRNVKNLFRGVKMDESYPPMKIETLRTFNDDYQGNKIVVAFGLRSNELHKYDDYENITGIIAHQWMEDSVKDWARTWGAIDIKSETKIEKTELPDKVVQKAFIDLSNSINMSTGIHHFMDEEQCKTYIRALNKYNYELNSKQIFSFLTTELNWESDYANDIIKLIDKVNSGGYFKGGAKTGLQHYIKRWKSE
ncbi:hypothetical protein [Leeuwenhoekiella sp. MAR_2009_132]|uniref:hypothetical protein n=1 Tax=Leeuwenhoekiella sp. MAR_2009_132 TaxID=1392489 RepID=UPI00048A6365|nr:hypothetical protein [Leeuwenhoekiella sp. MAR_2009_132]